MNKREATRIAHEIAYRFLTETFDVGGEEAFSEYESEVDRDKIYAAFDRLSQQHLNLSAPAAATPKTTQEQRKDARGDKGTLRAGTGSTASGDRGDR